MMKINIKKYWVTGVVALSLMTSCEDFNTDLDVEYTQDPSSKQLGIESTSEKIFHNWYSAVNSYNGPGLALTTMADETTCSWGNAGMRDLSSVPRVEFDNRPEYSNSQITSTVFNSLSTILSDSNSLIIALDNGAVFENPKQVESIARFGQALSVGYSALLFDKVWISDETGVLNEGEPVSYKEGIDFALKQIDKAIDIADNNEFTISKSFTNTVEMSNKQFVKLLNSFAARLLANSPRNIAERDALDWQRVHTYASKGITEDFNISGDGWNVWINEVAMYATYPGWGRTDMRVVNLMDPNTTSFWESSEPTMPESTSNDKRLKSDFQYLDGQSFKPDRGLYHYSSYRHSRYDEYRENNYQGDYPEMLKAEIDLYKAEAELRMGKLAEAAATINAGTRVVRGGLSPVATDANTIEEAIYYERSVELPSTGVGLAFFQMRRNNLLEEGTLLHFPVPGEALRAAKLPYYTVGGKVGKAGEDYSNTKGWRK